MYYKPFPWKIGDDKYNLLLSESPRGIGKTTRHLHESTMHAIETENRFIYIRRSDREMELTLNIGLYDSVFSVFNDDYKNYLSYKIYKNNIYLINNDQKEIQVGYAITLNNVKSIAIQNADNFIFDEYIASRRSAYKGGDAGINEPEMFCKLLETCFRGRKFWGALLGNHDMPSNPYHEYFKIPFGVKEFKDKSRGIFYKFWDKPEWMNNKTDSTIDIITKGTAYHDYSFGDKSLTEIDSDLICNKPNQSTQIANIKIFGKLLTVWYYDDIIYITDKCGLNENLPVMSVSTKDMTINTEFIRYNSQFLIFMRAYYGKGRVRFNNQSTAELILVMLSLND